ncbi:MAG: WGR domain-containing protein, partial [Deltaproteobacteria bacterium]|nr:WGR domain-containing protein [Deltaproteobacteria bacterium]
MPRYELVEGTSSKFWEIEQARGDSYTVRWGRIGSAGQTQLKKLSAAQHQKLVDEKLRKGYSLAGGATKSKGKSKAKPAAAAPAKAKPAASNPGLEATLYEAIDDAERWLVYADWLQQQGDVRGELITLNLRKKKPAAKKLAAANVDALWGDAKRLLDEDYFSQLTYKPTWSKQPLPLEVSFMHTLGKEGLVESITITGLDEDGHVAKALHDLLTAPIGRFVRSINIEAANGESYTGASGQPNAGAAIAAIARAKPTALRSVSLGSSGYQLSWTYT